MNTNTHKHGVDNMIYMPANIHWSTLLGQGNCAANLCKWGFSNNQQCRYGQLQMMSQILNECQLIYLDSRLSAFHFADDDSAVKWLGTLCIETRSHIPLE